MPKLKLSFETKVNVTDHALKVPLPAEEEEAPSSDLELIEAKPSEPAPAPAE